MTWTTQEIEEYCNTLAAQIGLDFDCPVIINKRLTKTLGRVMNEPTPFGYYPSSLEISYRVAAHAKDEDVRAVIQHELAHWAVTIETQEPHGHDDVFKAMCKRLGCPHDTPQISIGYDVDEDTLYKYVVYCQDCDNKLYYSRASGVVKHPDWYGCGKCGGDLHVQQNW